MSGDQPPPPGWVPPAAGSTPPPPGAPAPPPQPPSQPPSQPQPGPTTGWGTPPGFQQGAAPGQPYPGQPYPGQPHPGQPYPGQPHPGQPFQGQAYQGQPAPAAHKPGAIPLRPLTLGDIFDGAFRIIRYNPRATVGAAVLVSAVAMIIPVVTALVSGSTGSLRFDPNGHNLTDGQITSLVSTFGSFVLATQLQAIGLLFVSGMIAHVTAAAAVGRRLTMAQAWAATRGKRWRLLGMAVLLGLAILIAFAVYAGILVLGLVAFNAPVLAVVLVGLVLGAVLVVGLIVFWIRVRALAVPSLMLEPVGVFGALGRAVHLSREQFWRLFGILLLVAIVIGVAGSIVKLPFSVTGEFFLTASANTGYGVAVYVVLTAVGTVVSAALLQPFQAAVGALLYVDQRIRKEAYDVELLGEAGILPR